MGVLTRSSTASPPRTADDRPGPTRRLVATLAGPALIVAGVLFSLRAFAFLPRLSNQHPDILTFWLPRSCFMGRSLAQGHVPLWNPFEMAGTAFAADPQSGWLSASTMLTSWAFGCGDGLRALIVLNPLVAGLGMWWFLRREGLGRVAATCGGLALAMAIGASSLAISLPFAGALAWTTIVLAGASGFGSARGWRRLPWLALAALAWGQVATAHLSHGLVICTALVTAYVVARAIRETRAGAVRGRTAAAMSVGFLAFLPLANLAILIPRFSLSSRSSLRAGYVALGDTVATLTSPDLPVPEHGLWAAWPLAVASTPGGYLGATLLLSIPLALRDRGRRWLVAGVAAVGLVGYLLSISLFVGAGWFRALVLGLPFGDVYLHNPTRLRYLVFIAVPILGAIGIDALLRHPPPFRALVRWFAAGFGVFLAFPLVAGANALRLVVFAVASGLVLLAWWAVAGRRRWASIALGAVLVAELTAGAIWSTTYAGGSVYFGLEGADRPVLVPGPLRVPSVSLDDYLAPTPFTRVLSRTPERYLAWIPPAAFFNKGYLFTQRERDWPALLLGRALIFGLHDALGYSPIQQPRYWSYIRATNEEPLQVFYNAAVLAEPDPRDVALLGIRYLIVHSSTLERLPPGMSGAEVVRDRGYVLLELGGAPSRVSVIPSWTELRDGALALEAVLEPGFDATASAVVEGDPRIDPEPGARPGTATYREETPEDVEIRVSASAPSIVVVRNVWDRGWSATVDGAPAPVLRADFLLQGIPVDAGEHMIRLTYREPSIGVGLAASGVVWTAWLVMLAVIVARGRRSRSPARPRGA